MIVQAQRPGTLARFRCQTLLGQRPRSVTLSGSSMGKYEGRELEDCIRFVRKRKEMEKMLANKRVDFPDHTYFYI